MNGYTGKILTVDLTDGSWGEQDIPPETYERVLSGVGLAAHLLYRWIPAGADPLGPDNVLGLVSGLLTGTGALFAGRWLAVAKSPLTGTWGDANGFSHLRAALQGPSLTIPFENGKLLLGTWQQVVLAEFDNKPRNRKVVVQIIGE